jgi:hypothetical protein
MNIFVTCKSCWDLPISCHYWNLCMLWLFAYMWDVFVCDLVATIKVYQCDLYNMYLEQSLNFTTNTFWALKSLFECKHENIHMKWIPNLNSRFQHLAFEVNGQHIWVMHCDLETLTPTFVIEFIFDVVESLVKN